VEATDAPFSAHAVATLSLQTDVGVATVKQACAVFGISRQAYYEAKRPTGQLELPLRRGGTEERQQSAKEMPGGWATAEELEAAIRAVVDEHPAWGVRKVWATLRRAPYGIRAGLKRVWAMMNALGLVLPADGRREKEPRRGQVVVEEPNRRWSTDMTTVWTAEDGMVAVMPVIDCGCRTVLALEVSKSQEAPAVLAPVVRALREQFGDRSDVPDGLELRTDHTFAPVGRPTGNAAGERLIRTMKEECIWLRDWQNAAELRAALAEWVETYNHRRPHQALKWQTPAERRLERLADEQEAA
jgi:putative transposase